MLSREGHGALIVLERETGLEEIAETGVMVHADLSQRAAVHDLRARGPRSTMAPSSSASDRILAAAALLPLTEMTLSERFGTRHRAALGITEDTDAVAVVVSEESGQMSVVERARIVRVPSEAQLERALSAPARGAGRSARPRPAAARGSAAAPRGRLRIRTTPARGDARLARDRRARRRRPRRDADDRRPDDGAAHDGPPAPAAPRRDPVGDEDAARRPRS